MAEASFSYLVLYIVVIKDSAKVECLTFNCEIENIAILEVLHIILDHFHSILIIKFSYGCLLLHPKSFTYVLDEVFQLGSLTIRQL